MEQHTRLLDQYFRESFEKSMVGPHMGINKNPYAIIALGGYGRGEQCVHSDVDILFLFKKEIPQKTESLIREIIFPLWDIGLDIGHATRSLKECIRLAAKDFEVLTWSEMFARAKSFYTHYEALLDGDVATVGFQHKRIEVARTREIIERSSSHRSPEDRERGLGSSDP